MKNFMFKSLNKAISTPIAIIIVIVVGVFAIGGVLAYQYYWQAPEEEIPEETPKDETADWNNIAKSFCEEENSILRYFSLINFDQDKEKEIILMCGPNGSSWKSGDLGPLDLYVLNKENENYQKVWNKNTDNDFNFQRVHEPKIIDVNKDGIDEIVLSGSSGGGTCTGSFLYKFLYSPKHNELFLGLIAKGDKGYIGPPLGLFCTFEKIEDLIGCGEQVEGSCFSDSLKKQEYQIFKTYLDGVLEDIKNRVPVE